MVSVTSASHYHPHFQRRSSMSICGLIPRNFAELAEAVPIGGIGWVSGSEWKLEVGDNVKHDGYWITKIAYHFRKGSIYGSECGHS